MIVVKFGGSVLDTAEGLERACNEICALPTPLLVVVSAFRDVTNRLERVAHSAVADPARAREEVQQLLMHHRGIARAALSADACARWEQAIEPFAARLREVVEGLAIVGDLTTRTLDLVVHFGERLSSALVHAKLADGAGTSRVAAITALDLIITDTGHRYARPDLTLTREHVEARLLPLLGTHDIVVTEGYIARSTAGEATTMGRESSDYSATLLAEMIGAAGVTIYSSVPGVLTADPALVPEALTLPHLSYRMANTLAELGAKVLHPRMVAPAERANIPLVITCIGGASTTISGAGTDGCSIALLADATLVTAETETANAPVEPFLRAIAAETPLVWHQRFRRRLQVVALGGEIGSAASKVAEALAMPYGAARVAVLSVVCERPLDGASMARLLDACNGAAPLALLGAIEPGAVSVAADQRDARLLLADLHRRFIETADATAEGAERWRPNVP